MNKPGLIVFLAKHGIDASRVRETGADETGYDYIAIDKDGRPLGVNIAGAYQLVTDREEWPKGVWPKVEKLMAGAGLEEIGE